MLSLFIITSAVALKLSDPVSLRDVSEENMSLQAWCAKVGCVMPFTPKSCQSWCDWNVDKQADAEARGAFGSNQWGEKKQVKANTFWIGLSTVTAAAPTKCTDTEVKYYFQATGTKDSDDEPTGEASAVFPGGDKETKFAETELACKKCYKIASGVALVAANDARRDQGLATHYYVKFKAAAAGSSSVMEFFTNSDCTGLVFDPTLAAVTGQKTKRDSTDTPAACAVATGTAATALTTKLNGGPTQNTKMMIKGIRWSGTSLGGVGPPTAASCALAKD